MSKDRKISVQRVEINGQKFIQALIPDFEHRNELLDLQLSGSGNSFNYANTRESVDDLTVQVNCYVKKDTMQTIKAFKESEEAKQRMREEAEKTATLTKTLEKLSPLLQNPNLDKLLALDDKKLESLLAKVK